MKWINNLLIVSIALIFVFFVGFGIEAFYNTPQYSDVCPQDEYRYKVNITDEQIAKMDKCSQDYRDLKDKHNRNVFIITSIIGVITLLVTAFLIKKNVVSTGLFLGAVLTIIYGTIRYWNGLGDYLRFILLGIVLGILIWLGYKKTK
jgi:hypothetical protein